MLLIKVAYNAVSFLPVVSAIVLLQYDHCTLHGAEPLALEVTTHPLLHTNDESSQNSVPLVLQELVVLVLYYEVINDSSGYKLGCAKTLPSKNQYTREIKHIDF